MEWTNRLILMYNGSSLLSHEGFIYRTLLIL